MPNPGSISLKPFGRTGVQISALGLGGHHLGSATDETTAVEIVHRAIGGGVTFFDNCWEYNRGKSEDWLGKGLKGRRDKVFLMTKICTHGRAKDVAMRQLEESLTRLQTDHLDVWQVHEVIYYNDPEKVYEPDGVLEALTAARQQGKVRSVKYDGDVGRQQHQYLTPDELPA